MSKKRSLPQATESKRTNSPKSKPRLAKKTSEQVPKTKHPRIETGVANRLYSNRDAAIRSLEKYRNKLMNMSDRITGIGLGLKRKNGRRTNAIAIVIVVSSSADKAWLKANAEKVGYRKDYDGIDTDIIVCDFRTASSESVTAGSDIEGPGGRGKLGPKVIITVSGKRVSAWIVPGHIASRSLTLTEKSVDILLAKDGLKIGVVSPVTYYRNQDMDIAFVVPVKPLPHAGMPRKVVAPVLGMHVTAMDPVAALERATVIVERFSGRIKYWEETEFIDDHFIIEGDNPHSFYSGMSGATLLYDNMIVGVVRAAAESRFAACSRFARIQKLLRINVVQ